MKKPATQQRDNAPTIAAHSRRRSITAQRKMATLLGGVGFGTSVGGGVGGGVPWMFLRETLVVNSLHSGRALEGSGMYIFVFVVPKVLAQMVAT